MEAQLLQQRRLSGALASTSFICAPFPAQRRCLAAPRLPNSSSSHNGSSPAAAAAATAAAQQQPARPQQQQQQQQHPQSPLGRRPRPAAVEQQQQQQRGGGGLALPASEFARVRTAAYVGSAVDLRGCPPARHPEFAVIGRSNVGKSSLINLLTQSKQLAKVSKSPGMTKTINHFLINNSWYLVDLPGYGYAKTAGKDSRQNWLDFTKQYFLKRPTLVAVLLLVDGSIPPQPIDLECAAWLADACVPLAVVFTKCDARKKGGPAPPANMAAWKAAFLRDYEALPACFATSAALGQGRAEVLNYLASLRVLEEEEGEDLV